jgi:hypothetical protein
MGGEPPDRGDKGTGRRLPRQLAFPPRQRAEFAIESRAAGRLVQIHVSICSHARPHGALDALERAAASTDAASMQKPARRLAWRIVESSTEGGRSSTRTLHGTLPISYVKGIA